MSIKRYLFILFSTLITTIAVAQIGLLYFFKASIEDEIEQRSRVFANNIVNFAVESLDDKSEEETETKFIFQHGVSSKKVEFVVIEVEQHTDNRHLETEFEVPMAVLQQGDKLKLAISELPAQVQQLIVELSQEFNTNKPRRVKAQIKDVKVKIFKPRSSKRHVVKQELQNQIDKYRKEKRFHRETIVKNDGIVEQRKSWLNSHRHGSKSFFIDKLFDVVFIIIFLTTAIALVLVFWLSRKFSQPLQALSTGLKQLESGNFGVRVAPAGVQEVKQTINRFNAMSEQLVQLAQAEHKLMQQQNLMELSDVSKGIAHALRNPLHTIGLAVEQLSDDSLPESLKAKLYSKINDKIKQLDKHINALLTVTTGELDRSDNLLLSTLVNDIVLELKQSHQLQLGEIVITEDFDKQLAIQGSEKELRSVLHTLIFNAYEAGVAAHQKEIHIAIGASVEGDALSISIKDRGVGIPNEVLARMFEPHNSSKPEGAGMGLYIAKRIVELYYDGALKIENNEDGKPGAMVTLELKNKGGK